MQATSVKRTQVSKSGSLVVSDSEGGFSPDEIEVGGVSISELIETLFDVKRNDRGSLGSYVDFGVVKITIERLE